MVRSSLADLSRVIFVSIEKSLAEDQELKIFYVFKVQVWEVSRTTNN